MTLRIAFAGTPEFARCALAAIYAAGFEIPLVLTQPDRPAKRGMQLLASPVKLFAVEHGLPLLQTPSLRIDGRHGAVATEAINLVRQANCDLMVVAAYGLILPQAVLDIPKYGCINIHASLLPRWRGAAPIHRALEAGDAQTGISLMQMDAGLDTGAVLAMQTLAISPTDTCATLHDGLAALGAEMTVNLLRILAEQPLPAATPQALNGICYAEKIRKEEAILDFSEDAEVLARKVRAFNPTPGASTSAHGQLIKIWQAHAVQPQLAPGPLVNAHLSPAATSSSAPGTVVEIDASGIYIACGNGILCLTELQKAGGKRLPLSGFLQSFPLKAGDQLVFLPNHPII